jgi:hypothetical protein
MCLGCRHFKVHDRQTPSSHFTIAIDQGQKLSLRRSFDELIRKAAKNGQGEGGHEQDFV